MIHFEDRVYFDKDFMSIKINDKNPYTYDIEWHRIESDTDILGWVRHLCEKTWCDCELLITIIDCAKRHRESKLMSLIAEQEDKRGK